MASFLNTHTHGDTELGIVYDIGSGSVGGALVELRRNGTPHIIYTVRRSVPFQEQLEPDQLINSMKEGLRNINQQIADEGLTKAQDAGVESMQIGGIYCMFSSPWYISQTQTHHQEFEDPQKITSDFIEEVVEQERAKFQEGPLKEYKNKIEDELEPLEQHIIQIKLNGYETAEPANKTAKTLDLSVFFSVIPKEVVEDIHAVITEQFNTNHFHYNTFALASFSVLRNIFAKDMTDFLFMDVSGELTDISLIRDNILAQTVSFPIGIHELIRSLSDALDISPEEAESRLTTYARGDLNRKEEKRLNAVMGKVGSRWKKSFKKSVTGLFDEVTLPNQLFFIAAGNAGPIFKQVIDSVGITDHGMREGEIESTEITVDVFSEYRSYFKKHIERDHFLSMEALFANRLAARDDKVSYHLPK